MDVVLENYIKENYHENMVELLLTAIELIENFEVDFDDGDIVNRILNSYNRDDTSDQVLLEIVSRLDNIVKEHSLTLTPDCKLTDKIDIINVLHTILHMDDYNDLNNIVTKDIDHREIFLEVMEYLGQHSIEHYDITIEDIDPSTIDTLINFIKTQNELNTDSLIIDTTKIKTLKSLYPDIYILGYNLLESGLSPNYPVSTYLELVKPHLLTLLKNNLLTEFSVNLISLFLISNTPDITTEYKSYLNDLTDDLKIQTQTDHIILTIIGKL